MTCLNEMLKPFARWQKKNQMLIHNSTFLRRENSRKGLCDRNMVIMFRARQRTIPTNYWEMSKACNQNVDTEVIQLINTNQPEKMGGSQRPTGCLWTHFE